MHKFLHIILLSVTLTSGMLPAAAQKEIPEKAKRVFKEALQEYSMHNYQDAEDNLLKAISSAPDWDDPYYLLAELYTRASRPKNALETYNNLLSHDPGNIKAMILKSDVLLDLEEYEEALKSYQEVAPMPGLDAKYKKYVDNHIRQTQFIIQQVQHPVPFHPYNMGPQINSQEDEYLPTFTVDGETIYFTRKKVVDPNNRNPYGINEDLMYSQKQNGSWTIAQDVPGRINTRDNEGAMAISPDGTYMVFTGCERPDGLGSCDLYIAFYMNGQWTKPVNMGEPVNTRWKETQPSISYDGRTIYFSSNRPGTKGGLDIWTTTRDDIWNFGPPVNLGPRINTTEDEQTPFIHPDDQTLYFCSRGHLGMGMNDIYFSRKNAAGQWDSAYNMGYPINTTKDEPGLIVDREGRYAYYSTSAKDISKGGLDICYFELPSSAKPKPVTYLKGRVFDYYTKKPLVARLELVDLEKDSSLIRINTDEKGEVLVALPGGKDYLVNVSAEGYLFYSENLPLHAYTAKEPYVQDIPLRPIKAGEKITLENIFFKTDKYDLKKESRSELNRVIRFMQANPKVKIEVSGHTDNTGTAAHNKELSLNRAKAVYDYLITQGKIEASRLKYVGYGDSQPIAPNTTEEGKAKNRRTEMKVIE